MQGKRPSCAADSPEACVPRALSPSRRRGLRMRQIRNPETGTALGIFSRIAELMAGGAGKVGAAVSGVRALLAGLASSEVRREAAFAIGVIALSAKMAKADGVVTRSEVDAFCRIFAIPPGENRNVSRLYTLAKKDIAGFEAYARDIAHLLENDPTMLEGVLDGLFDIARADGAVHERELAYLAEVARIFGFDESAFARVRTRHVIDSIDPYVVLEADRGWDYERLRRQYRRLVLENHPDRLIAKGVPAEFIRIANDRLAAINAAWDMVERRQANI
jgi:DnaJ like chaperone protein